MADQFNYDVFLSHSVKDKPIVRELAERLRKDGLRVWLDEWVLKPGDHVQAKIEEGLEQSRVLVLCMSANAFGSDWAQLEAGTFRFRDPLNRERRFIPLRLDAADIKGSLVQFLYINWLPEAREPEYAKLVEACQPSRHQFLPESTEENLPFTEKDFSNGHKGHINVMAISPDGMQVLTGGDDDTLRLWELVSGRCLLVLKGHTNRIWSVAWKDDGQQALSGSDDGTVRLWDIPNRRCLKVLGFNDEWVRSIAWRKDGQQALFGLGDGTVQLWDMARGCHLRSLIGHSDVVWSLTWSKDGSRALSGSRDKTVRHWDVIAGKCRSVMKGHTGTVYSVAWSGDERQVLSGSGDKTVRLWELATERCRRVLEGHFSSVNAVSVNNDGRYALSCSFDWTVRLWELKSGGCLRVLNAHAASVRGVSWGPDGRHFFSSDFKGILRMWDLPEVTDETQLPETAAVLPSDNTNIQYTNAKVLLVGDTSSGKTGLAHRLATGEWKPSDGSTVGAWSTQWQLPDVSTVEGLEKEIWLWDFGGQADQRLVHQLYMDRTAMILLLFDADKEDVLPGLREWQTALRRCVPANTPLLLVAGRKDAGFKASRAKLQQFAQEQSFLYFETSAKEGWGCDALSQAITEGIPWETMERRTSPLIFKQLKDEILKLRDEGEVLLTFKELREMLWKRLPEESRFTDEVLQTVVGLLDGPGAVKDLEYGTYILLQPEWVNAYAQAVIRTIRQDPSELGCLPLRSIAEGKLLFQTVERDGSILEMKRLPEVEERVVLREMERQLEERGLCLRQGDKLVFPSHCGRERPTLEKHPSVFVSYAVAGYLDDIYATLVVKLADSESFKLKDLWREAADFETLGGAHHMGIKLTREAAGSGDISIYFAPGVTKQEQVIFANYIHAHLQNQSEKAERLRYYVCPHCGTPKGNPQVLMQKLLAKKTAASVECDICEKRFDLWDELEKLFASEAVRQQVEGMQAEDVIRLDSRRKGKLLALEVGARIASADQKSFEIPGTEDEGIDMELEFTDDDSKGTGRRLYLQLKSGNSHLKKRKDGTEVFAIKDARWVDYWLKQPHPVMLVIGTFATDDERSVGRDKLEFGEVRWMEISSVLQRESQNGTKPVKQIEFKGERLDMTSIRRWRERALGGAR